MEGTSQVSMSQPYVDFEALIAEYKRLLSMAPDSYDELKKMVARLEAEKSGGASPCDLRSLLIETAARFKDALLRHSIIPSKRNFDEPRRRIDACCAKLAQEQIPDAVRAGTP